MRAPDGLRGLTTASRSNLCSPCDRRQAVAGHAGSFTHRHRRVEFLACLQHAEAKHQKLAHGSDHNLLSLEAALSLEPTGQSSDRWVCNASPTKPAGVSATGTSAVYARWHKGRRHLAAPSV